MLFQIPTQCHKKHPDIHPSKQGLKRDPTLHDEIDVVHPDIHPSKQGLKRFRYYAVGEYGTHPDIHPSKQGLKQKLRTLAESIQRNIQTYIHQNKD